MYYVSSNNTVLYFTLYIVLSVVNYKCLCPVNELPRNEEFQSFTFCAGSTFHKVSAKTTVCSKLVLNDVTKGTVKHSKSISWPCPKMSIVIHSINFERKLQLCILHSTFFYIFILDD